MTIILLFMFTQCCSPRAHGAPVYTHTRVRQTR